MAKSAPSTGSPPESAPAPSGLAAWAIRALALAHFVCPLLFFTNLTRNPYFTQIALLYVLLPSAGLVWVVRTFKTGVVRLPLTGVEGPLCAFLAFALLTGAASWLAHPPMREGVLAESTRMWLFTLVNGVWAFYAPMLFIRPLGKESRSASIWPDLGFACAWGLLWFGFQPISRLFHSSTLVGSLYGTILWVIGAAYVLRRTREGDARSFFHIILVVALLAGGYALLQYAGRDPIRIASGTLAEGRPLSTFGNPNFLSSYLLLACLLALSLVLSSGRSEAVGYGLVSLVTGLAILCALTRSTYAGLFASLIVLGGLTYRRAHGTRLLQIGAAALAVLVLILIIPGSPVSDSRSPLGRVADFIEAMQSGAGYGPWNQRHLTWTTAWDMMLARGLLGVGWGCFEIFYPFYQGRHMLDPALGRWATHSASAHNIVLDLLSQVGTVGLGLALLFLVVLIREGLRTVRARTSTRVQPVAAGLLAAWLGMVVDNLLNVSMFVPMPAFLFWWYAGSLFNEGIPREERVWSVRLPAAKACLVGVAGLWIFSGYYYTARWQQERESFAGWRLVRANHLAEAIERLEAAHGWFPRDANTNYELGNSYVLRGEQLEESGSPERAREATVKAVWAYEEALKANPGYDAIHFNLGVAQLELGDEEGGLRHLRTAIVINPRQEVAYGLLSRRYVGREAWREAKEVLEQAVRAFPSNEEFSGRLAQVNANLEEKGSGHRAGKGAESRRLAAP